MGVGWNQGFAFDKYELSRVHRTIYRSDEQKPVSQWKKEMPMGPNAVEGNISYLKHLGLYSTSERELTTIGKVIAENDPGWRKKGSLFILYFNIATNSEATAWHYMANVFVPRNKKFKEEEAKKSIKKRVASKGISGGNAVEDIKIYLRSVTEDKAFGGIKVVRKSEATDDEIYMRKSAEEIPVLVLAYCLYMQRKNNLGGDNSVELSRLLNQNEGVGRVFNLSESRKKFLRLVDSLEHRGIASYTQTADLNDLEFIKDTGHPVRFVSEYYSES